MTALLTRKVSLKAVIAVFAAVLVGGAATAAFGAGAVPGQWKWLSGNENTYVGSPKFGYPANSMLMQVGGDLNVVAGHVRFVSDGNYEFEHGSGTNVTRLTSYYSGTPTRTSIAVGGDDGQDVLALSVQGEVGQTHDLQQWQTGTKVTTAIDGDGNLRLGKVVLVARIVDGAVELVAVLPDGTTQVLASGSPAQ